MAVSCLGPAAAVGHFDRGGHFNSVANNVLKQREESATLLGAVLHFHARQAILWIGFHLNLADRRKLRKSLGKLGFLKRRELEDFNRFAQSLA